MWPTRKDSNKKWWRITCECELKSDGILKVAISMPSTLCFTIASDLAYIQGCHSIVTYFVGQDSHFP